MPRKYICPSCKAKEGVDIQYGYPTYEAFEASERVEIALGGCCIELDSPERRCLKCEHEWRIEPRKYVCPACGDKLGVALRDGLPSPDVLNNILSNKTLSDRLPLIDSDRLCISCGHEWAS